MIQEKDITVSCPCLFEDEQPIWMLRKSAERFGWRLRPYGLNEGPYKGWLDLKLYRLREEARSCPTSHLLYTDARDAFFVGGPEEVVGKYNRMGAPPLLLSAQHEMFPTYSKWYEGLNWNLDLPFPYVSPPGMLCEAHTLAAVFDYMIARIAQGSWGEIPDDDPPLWLSFMKENPGMVAMDHACEIFQNCGSHRQGECDGLFHEDWLMVREERVQNLKTQSWPAVLHFNNGYSHHLTGKWDRLERYWRGLGYTTRPSWERV